MAYLLDTYVISELRKPHCDHGVAAGMVGIQPDEAFLSFLTLGEIRRGIELHRAKDTKVVGALERWPSQHTTKRVADAEKARQALKNPEHR